MTELGSASKAWFDRIVCAWSMASGHSFTEDELNSLVDALDAAQENPDA